MKFQTKRNSKYKMVSSVLMIYLVWFYHLKEKDDGPVFDFTNYNESRRALALFKFFCDRRISSPGTPWYLPKVWLN